MKMDVDEEGIKNDDSNNISPSHQESESFEQISPNTSAHSNSERNGKISSEHFT